MDLKLNSLVYDDEQLNELYVQMGKNVAKLREKEGLTISKMAELANLAPGHLFKVMYNQTKIGTAALFKIMIAFDVSFYDLVPLEDKPHSETNGEKFENLIQDCDSKTITMIFDIIENIVKYDLSAKKYKTTNKGRMAL